MKRIFCTLFLALMFTVWYSVAAYAVTLDTSLTKQTLSVGGCTNPLLTNYRDPLDNTNRCTILKRSDVPSNQSVETWMSYIPHDNSGYDLKGKFSVNYKIYFDEFIDYSNLFFSTDDNGNQSNIAQIYVRTDGMLSVGAWKVKQLEEKRWYNIKIVVSTDEEKICIYVDGERLSALENGSLVGHDVKGLNNCSEIRFQIGSECNGKYVLFDDMHIKSESGLDNVSDIKSFSILSDGVETDGLSSKEEKISVLYDIRIENESRIMLVAAMYDENKKLAAISQVINTTQSGVYQVDFSEIDTSGKLLKCFAWVDGTLVPVEMQYFSGDKVLGTDFGVFADVGDVTEELQNAINQVPDGATLVLEKGNYKLSPLDFNLYCLTISDKRNIIIDGNGSNFEITDRFAGVFNITGSANVTLKNFTIDFEKSPWQSGEVTAFNKVEAYFDIHATTEDSLFDNSVFIDRITNGFFTVRDDSDRTIQDTKSNEHYLVDRMEDLGDGNYRCYLSGWSANDLFGNSNAGGGIIETGDMITFIPRGYVGSNFRLSDSGNITIKDVTSYASAECGVLGINLTDNIYLENFNMKIKNTREISSNSDGVHCKFSRGSLVMENCTFEGLSDDCVNIYQSPRIVKEINGNQFILEAVEGLQVGDTITVFAFEETKEKGTAIVLGIEGKTVTFDGFIDDFASGDYIYINEGMFNGSTIRDCNFLNSRRYGLYLKCHGITVENNYFKNLGNNAVMGGFLPKEGYNLENAIFKNNTIENCGYLKNGRTANSAAFSVSASSAEGVYLHKNISFTGNKIIGAKQNAFYITSVQGLTFNNNEIIDTAEGFGKTVIANCIYEKDDFEDYTGIKNAYIDDSNPFPLNWEKDGKYAEYALVAYNENDGSILEFGTTGSADSGVKRTFANNYTEDIEISFRYKFRKTGNNVGSWFKLYDASSNEVLQLRLYPRSNGVGISNMTTNYLGFNEVNLFDGSWHIVKFRFTAGSGMFSMSIDGNESVKQYEAHDNVFSSNYLTLGNIKAIGFKPGDSSPSARFFIDDLIVKHP